MPAPLKVGVNIVFVKPQAVVRVSQAAEALGFESVWSGEHVAIPKTEGWWKNYPAAQALGEKFTERMMPFRPETDFLDPLIVLASIAAATSRIRLGIGIYLLALRTPILAGRSIASLDILSNGRLDLGVGLGWTDAEYTFTENDWTSRGRRMDECIRCLRALFEQDYPEFHGAFVDFPKIGFQPKPIQTPLPIHVGGFSAAAVKRAAALGNGWYGGPEFIPAVKDALVQAGRQNEKFEFSSISMASRLPRENLEKMAAQGVERAVASPWPSTSPVGLEGIDILEAYAKEIGLI